jgi:hypothetical protein
VTLLKLYQLIDEELNKNEDAATASVLLCDLTPIRFEKGTDLFGDAYFILDDERCPSCGDWAQFCTCYLN